MFVMSAVFRTMAAVTKTISQAMTLAGILVLALVVYTGYVLPVGYMKPWFKWIHYISKSNTISLTSQSLTLDARSDLLCVRDSNCE